MWNTKCEQAPVWQLLWLNVRHIILVYPPPLLLIPRVSCLNFEMEMMWPWTRHGTWHVSRNVPAATKARQRASARARSGTPWRHAPWAASCPAPHLRTFGAAQQGPGLQGVGLRALLLEIPANSLNPPRVSVATPYLNLSRFSFEIFDRRRPDTSAAKEGEECEVKEAMGEAGKDATGRRQEMAAIAYRKPGSRNASTQQSTDTLRGKQRVLPNTWVDKQRMGGGCRNASSWYQKRRGSNETEKRRRSLPAQSNDCVQPHKVNQIGQQMRQKINCNTHNDKVIITTHKFLLILGNKHKNATNTTNPSLLPSLGLLRFIAILLYLQRDVLALSPCLSKCSLMPRPWSFLEILLQDINFLISPRYFHGQGKVRNQSTMSINSVDMLGIKLLCIYWV